MSNKRLTAVWDLSVQSGTKLLTLLSLADRADDDGHCWPSHEDTAQRTRSKRTYINRLISEIEADGELYIYPRPGKTSRYLVLVGMAPDEILKAMMKRFGYSAEDAAFRVSEIYRCLQNRQVSSTGGVWNDVSVKQTPPVSSTEHEPSVTQNNKTNPQVKEGRERPPDPRLQHPAIIAYRETARLTPSDAVRDDLCTVDDVRAWRGVVKEWIGKGWNPRNISGMLDVYRNGGKSSKRRGEEPATHEDFKRDAAMLAELYGEDQP